jgi:hypothetical protein
MTAVFFMSGLRIGEFSLEGNLHRCGNDIIVAIIVDIIVAIIVTIGPTTIKTAIGTTMEDRQRSGR